MQPSDEYICLSCHHMFSPRKDEVGYRACSNCRSRGIVEFSTFARAVSKAAETREFWVKGGIPRALPALIQQVPEIRDIFAHAYFPSGVTALLDLLEAARGYNPSKGDVETYLRRWLFEKTLGRP